MIKAFIGIAIVLLVAVGGLLLFASTKPDQFRIERSITVNAPAEKIYPLINDFHQWTAWSPWEKMDPSMRRIYGGSASGAGATYAWAGDSKVGEGRMQITDSTQASKVVIRLDFLKPLEAHNTAQFTLEPSKDTTVVRWAMSGANTFPGKLIQVFISMDEMVGKSFEAGLADLKTLAER